ncbi:MAG: glycosyltransferase family 4 protein [Fimbriimonadaceae bacterium]
MRVLALLRQQRGGLANWAADAAEWLAEEGVELVVDDASWIPPQTGRAADREVTKRLKQDARGFDAVHALGYRTAWACAEAFALRFPWVYTAYDPPKTTHPDLVDRLNSARRGIVPSRSVHDDLDSVDVLHLEVMPHPAGLGLPDRDAARAEIGVPEDSVLVYAMGEFTPESGLAALPGAMEAVWKDSGQARLLIVGEGTEPIHSGDVRATVLRTWLDHPVRWVSAADLVVVPARRAGWSRTAVEAMQLGIPVVVRAWGGLTEIGDPGVSTWAFQDDEDLGRVLADAASSPLRRESIGAAGRAWVQNRLDPARHARKLAGIYREAVGLRA